MMPDGFEEVQRRMPFAKIMKSEYLLVLGRSDVLFSNSRKLDFEHSQYSNWCTTQNPDTTHRPTSTNVNQLAQLPSFPNIPPASIIENLKTRFMYMPVF